MQAPRRSFLKRFVGVMAMTLGGAQLAGCLGGGGGSGGSEGPPTQGPGPVSSSAAPSAPPAASAVSSQVQTNGAPVWQAAPTVEFIEGVPSVVDVRQFVQDPDQDPLVISLQSGALVPGITWNPNNSTLAYDGRPLGAKPDAAVIVSGLTFSADDQKP